MDISTLINLQQIDKQLIALEVKKGDLPDIVRQLEVKLVSSSEQLSACKSELEDKRKTSRANEAEIEELYEKL